MKIFSFLIFILLLFAWAPAMAQNQTDKIPSSDKLAVEIVKKKPNPQTETEEIDGLINIAGYLGKKLIKDVGERLPFLESNESTKTRKKIIMKVGPFRIERYEES
jgi:hypothetical protein